MLVRLVTICVAAVAVSGCVRRTITINTEPPGALAYLNDREVGRTPVDVDFVHYGTYSVRLELDGYESMLTSGDAKPPWWDTVGLDFFSELSPAEMHSEVHWHYDLQPEVRDPQGLLERARDMREKLD